MPSKYYMPGSRPRNFRRNRAASRIQGLFRRRRRGRRKSSFRKLKTMVYANQDLRWKSVPATNNPAPSGLTPAVDYLGLLDIGAGDEHYQRQGNKISLKSFNLKGLLFNSATDAYNKTRILIVQIRSLAYLAPTLGDIQIQEILEPDLTDPTSPTTSIFSHYKKNSKYKYKIIYDKLFQTQQVAAGSTRVNNIMFNIRHTFKTPLPVHYQSSSPDIPVQNMVCMFLLSDSTVAPHPVATWNTRITWTG